MTDQGTTFEDAKRCPMCDTPGREVRIQKTRNGRGEPCEIHFIECVRKLCRWFGERWIVQVNEDGSIPQPGAAQTLGEKKYPRLSQESVSRIEDATRAQLEAETRSDKHGEIRNPRA